MLKNYPSVIASSNIVLICAFHVDKGHENAIPVSGKNILQHEFFSLNYQYYNIHQLIFIS